MDKDILKGVVLSEHLTQTPNDKMESLVNPVLDELRKIHSSVKVIEIVLIASVTASVVSLLVAFLR